MAAAARACPSDIVCRNTLAPPEHTHSYRAVLSSSRQTERERERQKDVASACACAIGERPERKVRLDVLCRLSARAQARPGGRAPVRCWIVHLLLGPWLSVLMMQAHSRKGDARSPVYVSCVYEGALSLMIVVHLLAYSRP